MLIQTKYLNDIEITKDKILSFPNGILGFENHHEFVLLDIPDNDHFKFLQDIKNSYISFLLINPWDFFKDYDVELPDGELMKIDIDPNGENNMVIYNVITLGKDRKPGESIILGDNIEIRILDIQDGKIKVGIEAPKEVSILRK